MTIFRDIATCPTGRALVSCAGLIGLIATLGGCADGTSMTSLLPTTTTASAATTTASAEPATPAAAAPAPAVPTEPAATTRPIPAARAAAAASNPRPAAPPAAAADAGPKTPAQVNEECWMDPNINKVRDLDQRLKLVDKCVDQKMKGQ